MQPHTTHTKKIGLNGIPRQEFYIIRLLKYYVTNKKKTVIEHIQYRIENLSEGKMRKWTKKVKSKTTLLYAKWSHQSWFEEMLRYY